MADISKITIVGGTTYNIKDEVARAVMTGASSQANGAAGLVPQPLIADVDKFLCGDGTWKVPSGSGSISSITMNGTSYEPTSGVIDLGTVLTDDSNLVHKSGTESISGTKRFTSGGITIACDGSYRGLSFTNSLFNSYGYIGYYNGDGSSSANIIQPRFQVRQYSGNTTATTTHTGYFEGYQLPESAKGLAENKWYQFVTTKDITMTIPGAKTFSNTTDSSSTTTGAVKISGGLGVAKNIYGNKVWNAVWNDYAEFRKGTTIEGGYCLSECEDGWMRKTTKRLQAGCRLTSDTFGTSMGETSKAKTPIAVAGRVLAYTYEDRSKFKIGDAVCSAPNGKISVMSRREIRKFPDRIVGIVSEIPDYDIWYGGTKTNPQKIEVNGRIWIYVR